MQLDDVTDGAVEHVETRGLIDLICRFADVGQVEERRQDLVHPLNVLNLGVEPCIDIQYSGHVVIPIGLPLLDFVQQELFITTFILPVDQLELLSSGTSQIGNHYPLALSRKEGELGMSARSILFYLLPQQRVLLQLHKSRVAFLQMERIALKFILGKEHLD